MAPDPKSHDEQLAELLDELAERVRQGQPPDVEDVARQHPQFAGELKQLWAAVQITEEMASGVHDFSAQPARRPDAPTVVPASRPGAPSASESPSESGSGPLLPSSFGGYELQKELGRGGMGVVYVARQENLGRVVALKRILRGELAGPADLDRFRAEARAASHLDHPNIVPVYEVGEVDFQPFFTMQYVAGTTLSSRLADGPLPPHQAAKLLAAVARAIHYAHGRGVLHRDLKPSNILIDESGEPHVSDFGLAKRVEAGQSLTRSGAILGTPAYMAPEQASGRRGELGPATDVYSLGAILYQMLTGRPPFQAASNFDTILLVLEQDPLPPRLLNARADRDLELIALRCLQKLPTLRYPTAAALADDLEAYLKGEPITARSGAFRDVIARLFRETHHATVLENWGLLWMLHSAALLIICLITNGMKLLGVTAVTPYIALWTLGLGAWAAVFWALRQRAGPVTFVERQIAHLWAGSMASVSVLFVVERLLNLPVLTLSPVLAIVSGCIFLAKAGILSGRFYVQAVVLFATAPLMAISRIADYGISIFGVVSALCFFLPGLKYYRQRRDVGVPPSGGEEKTG
ncbi:MAG: protein kinase [Planctomycetia bacterium]|nr:protein kinase [Planctomycetia bacterium]